MQLNIKSEEAYRLAARLSELTGRNVTSAVTDALRQRVEAEEKARNREAWKQEIRAITAEIRAELAKAGGDISSNHDWLYDLETGLPI